MFRRHRGALLFLSIALAAACSDRRSPLAPSQGSTTTVATVDSNGNALTGTVRDSRAVPIAGATVEWTAVAEAWGDRGQGVQTDASGTYRIQNVSSPGGHAVVRASRTGYETQTKDATVSGPTVVDFELPRSTSPGGSTGTTTWTEIRGTQQLCSEITSQVGQTYPLWLEMHSDGRSLTLTLSHDRPPSHDPRDDDSPGVFTGTRDGDRVRATYQGPMGGLACPRDTAITPEVGGELTATIAGDEISGEYTEVYGTGEAQVTFVFRFQSRL